MKKILILMAIVGLFFGCVVDKPEKKEKSLSKKNQHQDYALIVSIPKVTTIDKVLNIQKIISKYKKELSDLGVKKVDYLQQQDATKEKILNYLKLTSSKMKKGDRFFMFFVGHGISLSNVAYNAKLQEGDLKNYIDDIEKSGVILPADFNPKDLSKSVFVISRDFKDIFEKIDTKSKKSFVIFDIFFHKGETKGEEGEEEGYRLNEDSNTSMKNIKIFYYQFKQDSIENITKYLELDNKSDIKK